MADLASCIQAAQAAFARDVREGLSKSPQKELHSQYFYNDVGSALFEVITLLPEYGLTRADERILQTYSTEIARAMSAPVLVAELGSGTGRKTRWLLEAIAARQDHVDYYPIDVSASALARCKQELSELSRVEVEPLEHSYLGGLREASSCRRSGERLLLLFLGSTIGNFERAVAGEFLTEVRALLEPGDALLIGADLEKSIPRMLVAYDDPAGVTAAFNLNLLARINRELGADFDLKSFEHEARYNETERRIEMHLRSKRRQSVVIPSADLTVTFEEGETIWTESSHKFRVEEMATLAERAGFQCERQWVDQEWPFVESLWKVVSHG